MSINVPVRLEVGGIIHNRLVGRTNPSKYETINKKSKQLEKISIFNDHWGYEDV